MEMGKAAAENGRLVTFGIIPDHAATGYGYILPTDDEIAPGYFRVSRFVEKPDRETASEYVARGYLWNSGKFHVSGQNTAGRSAASGT